MALDGTDGGIMKSSNQQADPQHHARNIQRMLTDLMDHCREDIGKVNEPKFQVLLETSTEVLGGLRTAYEHYEKKSEPVFA